MTLLAQILQWSNSSLKPWQQDAARRLFQNTLDNGALDDLYAMLKSSVGLEDPQGRTPAPLCQDHLPVTAAKNDAAVLVALKDIRNVNRLAANQSLNFSKQGVTVIYGANGAGKSGYSRVLKRACRARDVSEDVRPNLLDKAKATAIPEASFDIELGAKPATVNWKKNGHAPVELATIAVFDTHCARSYLDLQQEIAYLPYGLDVVENLAQIVLPKITEKLNAEIAATPTTKEAFSHLARPTKVSELIDSLSENTKIADVEALALMSEEETARMGELDKTLSEADPKAKAKELRLAIGRMNALKTKIESSANWVKHESVQKFRTMDEDAEKAFAAEAEAANVLRAGEALLPGTGDVLWKAMYEAAKQFSLGAAYPGQAFPHVPEGGKCLLCQQDLLDDGTARMKRFEEYVQHNVAKLGADKRSARATAISKIEGAALSIDYKPYVDELNHLDPNVVAEICAFNNAVTERQKWMLAAQKAHAWDGIQEFPADLCVKLKAIADALTSQAEAYEKATDDKQKLLMKAELTELKARVALLPQKDAVLALIERMRVKALLSKCKDDLKTKPISDKAKEFATNAVTAPLRQALKAEFDALGVAHMAPRLDESVERGKMKHKLALDVVIPTQIRDILSEGEQRAIALGCFLAELRTGGHGGGIVFDDPVSSLDHTRRQNVARRLIEEAKNRQVIIFTHDTSFLGELRDLIDQTGIDHVIHHLEWHGEFSGVVQNGLPWEHKSYKDRIDKLQKAQSALAAGWPPYPNGEQSAVMRQQYNLMRATIERVIQDLVFNGVVVRYRDWIRVTPNLSKVVGFEQAECDEIERLYQVCCDVVDAHDPVSGKNSPVPTATQLGLDIEALVALTGAIETRKKQAANGKS
ncbi:AAA family ATPase [Zoogloea sp. LCSB751]|uniref:AAA family ATPase n=1 Tax=Zoogloea sp. LCSB751 TaxID=1965277 RepID=UPI0009A4F926|nr:AAA family ATPase [Zoogloea sp. LCSB751]